jgi:hypothetical protein
MDDLISRQAAIDALDTEIIVTGRVNAESVRGYVNLIADRIKRLPSAQPLDPCETCVYKGKGWDEDPCDGCTGTESKYEPIVSLDGTLIVNVPKGTKVKRVIVLPYADG